MSQVSYGTITIVDTTDIERIYMVYAKSVSNTIPPSDELTWSESIASAPGEGDFIWQKTVVEKAITEEKTYSDPVCVTGSSGQGVEKIINYYCNYGQGQPEEDYSGWQLEIPEYDSNKPNYWTKVVVIYSDDTREDFQASGAIATFESEKVGVFDSLEVTLSPIQDLHGYDRPWVGGGGKNKLNLDTNVTVLSGSVPSAVTITSEDGSATITENYYDRNANKFGWAFNVESNQTYAVSGNITSGNNTTIKIYATDGSVVYTYNVSGSATTFSLSFDSSTNTTLYFYASITSWGQTITLNNVQIEKGTATSYEPYTNICPISGWDSVDVSVCGCAVTCNSTDYIELPYPIENGETYAYCTLMPDKNTHIDLYNENKTYIDWWTVTNRYPNETTKVNNTGKTIKYIRLRSSYADNYTETRYACLRNVTKGEEYNFTTHTTTLPQTVYGGTLDVVSGVLTVDRAMVTLNGQTTGIRFTEVSQTTTADGQKYVAYISMASHNIKNNNIAICDAYAFMDKTPQNMHMGEFDGRGSYFRFVIADQNLNTLALWNAHLAENPMTLVYELATPQTYQLTPTQIDSLLGRNNVWSDGTVEVEGHTISKKDIMIYKDNGLTDVANKSAEANTNAAEALEKANDGIISTTQLWYQTNSTSAPSVPTNHSQVDQGTVTYNNWRSVRPNNSVNSYKYYYYCYEYLHGDGTYTYSAEAILDTSNLSQYQIDQLQVRIKKIWSNSTGSYMASGIGANEVDIDNSSTYGFNSKSTTTGVSFNYNAIPLTSLGTDGIKLYSPTLTNGVITGSRLDATLNTNGLILNKGGIKAGEETSNFIYLSTDPYGNYSINGSSGISDWKQIIGTKFGVRADGTLYANNANISGAIDATSFIAKSYTGTTLNRQMSLGADGLKLMDGSGTILSQIDGLASTIGKTSGAHFIIDADGQRFYASDGTTQLANIGYGPGTDSGGGTSNAPYYTLGRRDGTVGNYSTAEGYRCEASGYASHAEGFQATASGSGSHAEGNNTNASGMEGHAEGVFTTASGGYSHAEGNNTTANGGVSHAEGQSTTASGTPSHAEGYETTASGYASHAEGYGTTASGAYSHAQNRFTVATEYNQTVIGKYNSATVSGSGTDDDPYVYTNVGNYALIIGNGTANTTNDRSNALTVDWNGDISRYTGWDGSSIPSAENGKHYEALDTSGRWVGRVSSIVYSGSSSRSGQVGTLIRARHPSAPNNPNTIGIYVDDTGAMDYTISSPSAFRSALGIAVAVVGTGSSNGWVWRKYSDNTFDAWYSGTATTAINSVVGSLYQSGSNLTLTMPSGIGATSVLYGDVNLITSSYGVWTYIITLNSTTFSYRGMSALSRASASYTVKAYVRGAYS